MENKPTNKSIAHSFLISLLKTLGICFAAYFILVIINSYSSYIQKQKDEKRCSTRIHLNSANEVFNIQED